LRSVRPYGVSVPTSSPNRSISRDHRSFDDTAARMVK
jgi:hypothetical protein